VPATCGGCAAGPSRCLAVPRPNTGVILTDVTRLAGFCRA
jgi:hypothetical protein